MMNITEIEFYLDDNYSQIGSLSYRVDSMHGDYGNDEYEDGFLLSFFRKNTNSHDNLLSVDLTSKEWNEQKIQSIIDSILILEK